LWLIRFFVGFLLSTYDKAVNHPKAFRSKKFMETDCIQHKLNEACMGFSALIKLVVSFCNDITLEIAQTVWKSPIDINKAINGN
jgi:hypothetical protein